MNLLPPSTFLPFPLSFPAPELAHLGISSLDSSPGCLSDPTETFFFFLESRAQSSMKSGGGKGSL